MFAQLIILGIDIRPGDIISRLPGVPVASGADVDPKYPHSRTLTMADGSLYFCDPQQEYTVSRPKEPVTFPGMPSILVLGPCADEDERRDLRMSAFDVADQLGFPVTIATSLDVDVRQFAAVVLDQHYLNDTTAAVLWVEAMEAGVPVVTPADPRDSLRCDACRKAYLYGVVRSEFECSGQTLSESLCATCDDRTPGCGWCLTSGEETEPVSDGGDGWVPLCGPCTKVQKARIRRQGGRRTARKVLAA
ncbi:hypothetical protein ACFW95_34510 [Streptomyces sp. NPDC059474]|uniref:hypothetical protein n=1 Tax=Streptomyces sp. NPDC059474 TaxID=3346846 RepID=UPI00369999DB